MMRFILPFIVFMIMAAFMYVGLSLDPHEVPSDRKSTRLNSSH